MTLPAACSPSSAWSTPSNFASIVIADVRAQLHASTDDRIPLKSFAPNVGCPDVDGAQPGWREGNASASSVRFSKQGDAIRCIDVQRALKIWKSQH